MSVNMNKAILFDIDGTLTTTLSGEPFKQNSTDIKIFEGIENGLISLISRGYLLIGISNQGGVGAGHKSIEEAIEEMQNTLKLLPQLECIYICPDFEGNKVYEITLFGFVQKSRNNLYDPGTKSLLFDSFRKPSPGMLQKAIRDFNLDVVESIYVGDRPEDKEAASGANIRFISADVFRQDFLI